MDLNAVGWKNYSSRVSLPEGSFDIGRVSVENKTNYEIISSHGRTQGLLRGKMLQGRHDLPKVGDWVKISKLGGEEKVLIEEVLPRFSKVARKSPDGEEQVIVTNVDVVFIVQSFPLDVNLRRLERYIAMAKQSGAEPVIVLNKIDLNGEFEAAIDKIKEISGDADVIGVSARTGDGLEKLRSHLSDGLTFAFLGSSGVGKSSLINSLVGDNIREVAEVREDDQEGRHTTTRREMILLDDGSILIDTPGMRELGLWSSEEEIEKGFQDIEDLAEQCLYSNCDHEKSDGCAVKQALQDGTLDAGHYENYLKLKKEAEYMESRYDLKKKLERKQNEKKLNKNLKKRLQDKY